MINTSHTSLWSKLYGFRKLNLKIKIQFFLYRKNSHLPAYDENLINYGMNKVMHIGEMFAAK